MRTKQQSTNASPSDKNQAARTAANKRKHGQGSKPDYTRRKQRIVQYHRDPCDVVEMFYIATRARLH